MFEASMIMKTDVVSVSPKMPIYEAIKTLVEYNLSSIPVVDSKNKICGMLSEKDVLHLLNESTSSSPKDKTVNDFMTVNPISFDQDEAIFDI